MFLLCIDDLFGCTSGLWLWADRLCYGTCCIMLCLACSLSPCALFAWRAAHRSREITCPCLNLIGPQDTAMACVWNGELGSISGCGKRYISWVCMLRDCWINLLYMFKKLHYALGYFSDFFFMLSVVVHIRWLTMCCFAIF